MSSKEDILTKFRANVRETYDMPSLDDIKAVTYPEPLVQFMKMSESVGGQVLEVDTGRDINVLIRDLFPDAKKIASNLPEVTIATRNPDTIGCARDLNGTDVGIIRGEFGVAENGCIWVPQQMKEKAVCFISENLVILLPKSQIATYRCILVGPIGINPFNIIPFEDSACIKIEVSTVIKYHRVGITAIKSKDSWEVGINLIIVERCQCGTRLICTVWVHPVRLIALMDA